MRQYLVYLCFVWVLLGSSAAWSVPATAASPDKIITIAAVDNWPPFSDEIGRGLSYTLVQAALRQSGYQLKTVVVPYARALYYTEHNMVDGCWNVTKQQIQIRLWRCFSLCNLFGNQRIDVRLRGKMHERKHCSICFTQLSRKRTIPN